MPFFQLGEMGRPFYGEDWAADASWRMRAVYEYTADKINQEGERNVTRGCMIHHLARTRSFSLEERVYFWIDRQSFAKVKNMKWIKCWKKAIIT